jgi:pyrophosphatase PpaX
MTPRWPVVLFDLDGTLANSLDVIVASYGHAFATVSGRKISGADALPWIGQTLAQTFTREDAAHADALEAAYRAYNEAHIDDMITGYPGLPQLVDDLNAAGVRTGVVTAKRTDIALRTMALAGLDGKIELVGAMEHTSAHKPDPAPLLAACAALGVEPTTACYVGDAIFDIQAAHAAGMAGVAVTWGAGLESDLVAQNPAYVCHDAAGLRSALFA